MLTAGFTAPFVYAVNVTSLSGLRVLVQLVYVRASELLALAYLLRSYDSHL